MDEGTNDRIRLDEDWSMGIAEKWLLLIKGAWRERLANLFGRKDHYNFTQVGHYPMIKYRLQYPGYHN